MKKVLIALFLISQISIIGQEYKFGKISKAELEEKFYPLDSTADAAYLYKYRRTYYDYVPNSGFQLITEIRERIKIYTKEGFDMATRSVSYYAPDSGDSENVSSIKGYTFTLINGEIKKEKLSKKSIFKEKINKFRSVKKITMPAIKEGCIIEVKYKVTSPYIQNIDKLRFQYGIPVKKLAYRIEVPEFFIFNKKSIGYYFVKMIKESKNAAIGDTNYNIDVFKFKDSDIPALKDDEPFISSIYNYRGGMKFELTQTNFLSIGGSIKSYSTTWETVSKQIYKSSRFGSELHKSNYYKDNLATILTTAKTAPEKVVSILEFVKKQVKWNDYVGIYTDKGVKKAYKERVGNTADINLMLTSMLRSAGLNANPVLVSTRSNGVPLFPTLDGFNYVISMVEFTDGSYVLLDATEKYSVPNILPKRDLNWNGRKITKDGSSSWVKLTSSKPALEENNVMIKISDDLLVEGMMRTKYDNLNALNFRKNNNHLTEEELITKLEEKEGVEIDDFKMRNEENLVKPIIRNVKFASEDLIEEVNGKLYLEPMLFLAEKSNPFKLEERKFPVDFATPWKDRNRVSIQIPSGYKVEKLPASLAIALPENLGVFKYQVTQKGNKISAVSILQFNSAIIAAHYYADLKFFYSAVVQKQSEKIVLVRE